MKPADAPIFAEDLPARLGEWGKSFCFDTPADRLTPCRHATEAQWLRETVLRLAAELGTDDLRAAGSLWAKYYHSTILPVVLAPMTLHNVGLEVPCDCASVLVEGGFARRMCIPTGTRVLDTTAAEHRHRVMHNLIDRHLEPFIEAMGKAVSLPRRILWSDVAIRCAYFYQRLLGQVACPKRRAAIEVERDVLLHEPLLPWNGRPNPLARMVRWEGKDAEGQPKMLRRACCLSYRLPSGGYCGTCPLNCARQARGSAE